MTNGNNRRRPAAVFGNAITVFAFLIVLAYFAGLILLFVTQINVPDNIWTRTTYLVGGLEAIVFAATGYLFGREVHRDQAAKAEQRATRSESDAASGKTLAENIRSKDNKQAHKSDYYGTLGPPQMAVVADADFKELADMANRLFPPV
jgi:hypothetical protein